MEAWDHLWETMEGDGEGGVGGGPGGLRPRLGSMEGGTVKGVLVEGLECGSDDWELLVR
jgi:hypothetical protein